ncbi:energy-coupling factor ABC transporter ATP-binding protein [Neobacillus sp. NPDC093127]|uniref:energy-coupling factor ABC transporter ATP-binding protein n=1 Tax=Neobacillus sp. NPDC093127 TaxID=3364296 RepID=UPI00380C19E5
MNETIVDIQNLRFKYMSSKELVLKGIDLQVKRGEFIGIIGPSGAGKTTLVSCIKGLIPHTINGKIGGKIDVFNMDMKKHSPDQIAEKVGMVMQDPEGQIIGLTVQEDLAFGPENFQWPVEKILEIIPENLKRVRLDGLAETETYSLSGGQKQRLSIAGALMTEPELLILDEPTSELDPIGREEVFATIKRLKEEKDITVIVVEQTVEELIGMCDRIVVMKDGLILADDHPKNIFKNKDIFWGENRGEIPIPQTVELSYMLSDGGYIRDEQISPYEQEIAQTVQMLVQGGCFK